MDNKAIKRSVTLFIISFLWIIQVSAQEQINKVSFLFAGDAMQHQAQLDDAKTADGYDYFKYFKNVKDKIQAADIAVVNLEVTLPGKAYTGYPCFGSPDAFALSLQEAGFDIFLTANNHCLDKGSKGVERTIAVLDTMGVRHIGTFGNKEKRELHYPLMMIKNGIRIAMLNYTYGTNDFTVTPPNVVNLIDRKQILEDIAAAKMMKADIIVANIHWGEEYKLKQNKRQTDLGDFLVRNGVRLVIGGHPHVVQPIDIRKDDNGEIQSVVVYSMGNFISGMKLVDTMGGLMAHINISKEEGKPVTIDTCDYSLVWVHRLVKNKILSEFELVPVDGFNNEEGKEYLGIDSFSKMQTFSTNAKNAIESMW